MHISTSDIDSWIWSAIIHNIQELDLLSGIEGPIQLPRFLFTLKSLRFLSLKSKIGINNLPESILLPSLNRLDLEDFAFVDDSVIVRFLSGSPTLQELVLKGVSTQSLCVCSSSLKHFKIKNTRFNLQEESFRIVIDAPNLEFLELRDRQTSQIYKIEVKNLTSIVNVIHMVNLCDNVTALHVLMQISRVKILSLPSNFVKVNKNLPCLRNLTQLVVTCRASSRFNLLQSKTPH
ncbi:F-box/FBD/LRR-repeat protein At1g16930-like [Mercurialis annua]|uniref:F-box/FBD/LRR-repeat protein At1g16930-like n=1 Tax=Mercurialis annua TaxID=3986 RepID=UPI0024AD3B09|nr:F-box/FBD/LRR-repeat protein At1g16930-like [Mercurialis annua]